MLISKKINWISILQAWAMLWVVIGHACLGDAGDGPVWENVLYRFAYSFHMHLFMVVSGYLFYLTRLSRIEIWGYWKTVYDKAVRLLIPMMVFTLIAFAAKIAMPAEMNRPTGFSMKELLMAFLFPDDSPLREMWFIATLFCLFLLMPFWRWCLRDAAVKWGVFVGLIVLHFYHPDVQLFCIGRVCEYAIWFYCGVLLSESAMIEHFSRMEEWLTLLSGMAVCLVGFLLDISFVETVGGIILSLGIARILDVYVPRAFFSFRDYTYQIFLVGIFVQILVKIIYRHTATPYALCYLISVVAALYVPVLLSKAVQSIGWKPFLLALGLKSDAKQH